MSEILPIVVIVAVFSVGILVGLSISKSTPTIRVYGTNENRDYFIDSTERVVIKTFLDIQKESK